MNRSVSVVVISTRQNGQMFEMPSTGWQGDVGVFVHPKFNPYVLSTKEIPVAD